MLIQPSTYPTTQANENMRQNLQSRPQEILSLSQQHAIDVATEQTIGDLYNTRTRMYVFNFIP